jgi:hypothetical protein
MPVMNEEALKEYRAAIDELHRSTLMQQWDMVIGSTFKLDSIYKTMAGTLPEGEDPPAEMVLYGDAIKKLQTGISDRMWNQIADAAVNLHAIHLASEATLAPPPPPEEAKAKVKVASEPEEEEEHRSSRRKR